MLVGLSLLEWIEKHLQSQALLPTDVSEVHRLIDFAGAKFELRWASKETLGRTLEVRLEQKLAQLKDTRPMMHWVVTCDGEEGSARSGQMLLTSTVRPIPLAEAIAEAVKSLVNPTGSVSSDEVPEIEETEADPAGLENILRKEAVDLEADPAGAGDPSESRKGSGSEIPAVDDSDLREELSD